MKLSQFKEISKEISVLCVEDNKSTQELLSGLLSEYFTHLAVANDGEEGLKLYNEKRYDIVITDIEMPKKSGIEMVQEIKKKNPLQNIVVLSIHDESVNLLPLINEGVDRFVHKPVNAKLLLSVLAKISAEILTQRQNESLKHQLRDKNAEMQKVFDHIESVVFLIDNGKVELSNIKAVYLSKEKTKSGLQNLFDNLNTFLVKQDGFRHAQNITELIEATLANPEIPNRIKFHIDEVEKVYAYSLYQLDESQKFIFTMNDITSFASVESLNPITELPNSIAVKEKIQEYCKEEKQFCAIIFTITNIGLIRKWHGYEAGVSAEKQLAQVFKYHLTALETECYFANYGIDRFLFFLAKEDVPAIKKFIKTHSELASVQQSSQSRYHEIPFKFKYKLLKFKTLNKDKIIEKIEEGFEKILT